MSAMAHKWNHNFPKIAREAGFTIRELSVGHCIDWRFIASIDPYAIVGDKDYEKLDEFIPHISEVPIGTVLNNRILDPAIGKYFILAQFSIQYLLFCKQFLDETVVEIRNTAQDVQKENNRLEKICRKKNEEIVSLHRKLQRAENAHTQQIVYPCSKCTKNFISLELLNAHMARKHVETMVGSCDSKPTAARKFSETDSNLINTIKLELEVKQLKERLNAAEKDLMDQRSRDHRCHVCSDERLKDREKKLRAVEWHSIGIQSNLEDAKDVNEKEVQTSIRSKSETPPRLSPIPRFSPSPTRPPLPSVQSPQPPASAVLLDYISKSELETIVREQNEQFESWKRAERHKFNNEIVKVRQSLTEAIQELEKRDRMAAVVQTASMSTATVERKEEDENIWKMRYRELEQMYENSQRQVRETVENIESVYEEKFRHIERMMERQKVAVESISKERNEGISGSSSRLASESSLLKIPAPKIDVKASLPTPSVKADEESEIDEAIMHEESASEETEQSESDEEIRALEAVKAKMLARVNVPRIEEPKEVPASPEKPLISPKKQILNTFKSRLKFLGIDSKAKALSKEDLNVATEALANRRDASKKKNRGFFITRNQLMAKVDQIAKSRTGEGAKAKAHLKSDEQPVIKKRESQAQPVPKLRSTFQGSERNPVIDILPSKLRLTTEDRLTVPKQINLNATLFKAKSSLSVPEVTLSSDDILTVQAEINPLAEALSRSPIPSARTSPRPSMSEYERHLERLLDTPVKRLSSPPDVITVESGRRAIDNDSDLSDFLEAVPLQPKPIPKKRVLFNLDRDTISGGAEKAAAAEPDLCLTKQSVGPTLSSTVIQVSRVEEDSDWNISSFDDEK